MALPMPLESKSEPPSFEGCLQQDSHTHRYLGCL